VSSIEAGRPSSFQGTGGTITLFFVPITAVLDSTTPTSTILTVVALAADVLAKVTVPAGTARSAAKFIGVSLTIRPLCLVCYRSRAVRLDGIFHSPPFDACAMRRAIPPGGAVKGFLNAQKLS